MHCRRSSVLESEHLQGRPVRSHPHGPQLQRAVAAGRACARQVRELRGIWDTSTDEVEPQAAAVGDV